MNDDATTVADAMDDNDTTTDAIKVRTRTELVYGNPGERRTIPAGTQVSVTPASNLPGGGYWITPEPTAVDSDVTAWAEDVGCHALACHLDWTRGHR
jgi:hypothetical protein